MLLLLSIKPCHAENILAGRKRYEFRRRIFCRLDVRTVLIYATTPVQRFVGEFDISDILQGSPASLWRKTRHASGISKAYFDEYFADRDRAFALSVGAVRRFTRHIVPSEVIDNFVAPQSYMYVRRSNRNQHRLDRLNS